MYSIQFNSIQCSAMQCNTIQCKLFTQRIWIVCTSSIKGMALQLCVCVLVKTLFFFNLTLLHKHRQNLNPTQLKFMWAVRCEFSQKERTKIFKSKIYYNAICAFVGLCINVSREMGGNLMLQTWNFMVMWQIPNQPVWWCTFYFSRLGLSYKATH